MTKEESLNFIDKHLYNELRWLICAAASWKVVKDKGTAGFPSHFIVFTMDSAFLHSRALFEFFTHTNPNSKPNLVTYQNFNCTRLESELYHNWMGPLHCYLMHIENRESSGNIIDGKHLNEMVFEFAVEIVRLWKEFSNQVDADYKKSLDLVLEKVISEAEMIMPEVRTLF